MKHCNNSDQITAVRIGKVLRDYRILNGYSASDVADILHYSDPVTIYNWENGHRIPNCKIFLKLCSLYHIHAPLESFGLNSENEFSLTLTKEECRIIQTFRQNPALKQSLFEFISQLKEQISVSEKQS